MEKKRLKLICPQCDLVLEYLIVKERAVGICPRCGCTICHFDGHGALFSLCYALTALIFLVSADLLPFIGISSSGMSNQMQILDYAKILQADNLGAVSFFICGFTQLLPMASLLTIALCSALMLMKKNCSMAVLLLKFYGFCKEWSMAEVFLVATLVSLIKLFALVDIAYGWGFFCFFAFTVCYVLAINKFNEEQAWGFFVKTPEDPSLRTGMTASLQHFARCERCGFAINLKQEDHCSRCLKKADLSKRHSLRNCFYLVITALILYIPANLYPMMITSYLGKSEPSTIIEGVFELWQMGSYFVASVIVVASVCIPVLKMAVLLYLCFLIKRKRRLKNSQSLSAVYRLVEFIGKWSMVDVFVVAIMATIVRIGNLMVIYPGEAVLSFAGVVILTMLAAKQFDPRLLWEREISNEQQSTD